MDNNPTRLVDAIRTQIHAVRNADDTDAMHRESVTLTDLVEQLDNMLRTGEPLPAQWRFPINSAGGKWVWRNADKD